MRNFILMMAAASALIGCGLKGPLYLPADKLVATPPPPPAAARPAAPATPEENKTAVPR